jgi:hypothetical protein
MGPLLSEGLVLNQLQFVALAEYPEQTSEITRRGGFASLNVCTRKPIRTVWRR